MVEKNEGRLSFSSLNPQLILHRHSSASSDHHHHHRHHHLSGISTPPLQTPASVPFKWEQEPGKPRAVSRFGPKQEPEEKSLEPPPFRAMQQVIMNIEYSAPKIAQPPSRSILDDGPYKMDRPMFSSSRFSRDGPDPYESYDVTHFDQGDPYSLLGSNKGGGSGERRRRGGLLGKFKAGKSQRDHHHHHQKSSSSNSSCDSDILENHIDGGRRMRRIASFSHHHHHKSTSHIWATIYGGLKQVVQWKSSSRK